MREIAVVMSVIFVMIIVMFVVRGSVLRGGGRANTIFAAKHRRGTRRVHSKAEGGGGWATSI